MTAPQPAPRPAFLPRLLLNFAAVYFGFYFLIGGQPLLPLVPAGVRHAITDTVAHALLSASLPPLLPTGSGDTASLWVWTALLLVLSVVASLLWTALRPGADQTRLRAGLHGGLRLALIVWLAIYGLSKFNFGQFGLLSPEQMATTSADSSPMGLLWRLMAASPGYQWVAGVAEVLPAVLLLHRRTATVGALIAAVTITNVFALNLFYDVPVKLFSFHLLLAAVTLLVLDRRFLLPLLHGGAVPARDWVPRKRWIRALPWITTVLLLGLVGFQGVQGVREWRADRATATELLKTRGFHWVSEFPYNH